MVRGFLSLGRCVVSAVERMMLLVGMEWLEDEYVATPVSMDPMVGCQIYDSILLLEHEKRCCKHGLLDIYLTSTDNVDSNSRPGLDGEFRTIYHRRQAIVGV